MLALILAVTITPLAQEPASSLPSAESILEKVEAAIGDAAARAKSANIVMTGTIGVVGMEGSGTFEEVYSGPTKAKYTATWPGMDPMTQGTTGPYSWSTESAMGIVIKEGDQQGAVLRQFAINRRADWKSMYARAENAGRAEHDGRACWKLVMHPKTGKPETWYVDAERNELARVDLSLPDPMGGELPMQFHFADFKKVDGVTYPHVKKQVVGTLTIVFTFQKIEHTPSIAAERVAPPADVIEAWKNPKKRAKEAPAKAGECSVETIEPQPYVTIRTTTKASEVSKALAKIFPEVGAYCAKLGVSQAGPPFTRYHKVEGDTIDLEAGVPVKKAVAAQGRILAGELPGGPTAVTWHVGAYSDLPRTYKLLEEWMKANGRTARGPFWEIYWTDPGIEPDPSKWRTQILWPVQ